MLLGYEHCWRVGLVIELVFYLVLQLFKVNFLVIDFYLRRQTLRLLSSGTLEHFSTKRLNEVVYFIKLHFVN